MDYKELWIAAMEERMAELIDGGMDEVKAYALASEQAHDRMVDKLADLADNLRKRERENGR